MQYIVSGCSFPLKTGKLTSYIIVIFGKKSMAQHLIMLLLVVSDNKSITLFIMAVRKWRRATFICWALCGFIIGLGLARRVTLGPDLALICILFWVATLKRRNTLNQMLILYGIVIAILLTWRRKTGIITDRIHRKKQELASVRT